MGPETLKTLGNPEWSPAGIELRKVRAMDLEAHADAWEALIARIYEVCGETTGGREHLDPLQCLNHMAGESGRLRKRLEAAEKKIQMVCESGGSHHPDCPQFDGPYDLGELEPACTCWKSAALAGEKP